MAVTRWVRAIGSRIRRRPFTFGLGCVGALVLAIIAIPVLLILLFAVLITFSDSLPKSEYASFNPAIPRQLLEIKDGSVNFWDVTDGDSPKLNASFPDLNADAKRRMFEVQARETASFSPDGKYAAVGCSDGSVYLFENLDGKITDTCLAELNEKISCVAFSADSMTLATGTERGTLSLWNLGESPESLPSNQLEAEVREIAFSPKNQYFIALTHNRGEGASIHLFNRDGYSSTFETISLADSPSIAFHPSGDYFLYRSSQGVLQLMRIIESNEMNSVTVAQPPLVDFGGCLEFSEDGKYLASTGQCANEMIWNVANHETMTPMIIAPGQSKFDSFPNSIHQVNFFPDNTTIAYVKWQSDLYIHSLATGPIVGPILTHKDGVVSMSISSDGALIATVGMTGSCRIWNQNGTPFADFARREAASALVRAWFNLQ